MPQGVRNMLASATWKLNDENVKGVFKPISQDISGTTATCNCLKSESCSLNEKIPRGGSRAPSCDWKTRQQRDTLLHRYERRPFQIGLQSPHVQQHFPESQTQKQHFPQQVHLELER